MSYTMFPATPGALSANTHNPYLSSNEFTPQQFFQLGPRYAPPTQKWYIAHAPSLLFGHEVNLQTLVTFASEFCVSSSAAAVLLACGRRVTNWQVANVEEHPALVFWSYTADRPEVLEPNEIPEGWGVASRIMADAAREYGLEVAPLYTELSRIRQERQRSTYDELHRQYLSQSYQLTTNNVLPERQWVDPLADKTLNALTDSALGHYPISASGTAAPGTGPVGGPVRRPFWDRLNRFKSSLGG